MLTGTSSQHQSNQMATKITKISLMPSHSMNLRLLHLLTVLLLSAHLGIFVYADSKELYEDASQAVSTQDVDNYINDDGTSELMEKLKRSWKSLQGSWGKRSDEGSNANSGNYESEQQPEWTFIKPIENSNEPDSEPSDTEPEAMKYYVLYGTNPNMFDTNVGGGVSATSTGNVKNLLAIEQPSSNSNLEKKSWKNMNVAWGKRRSQVWNKFRGAWGKREPAWNNLKGMWGKRSTKDWKKLQSGWGKRSQQ